jgi:type IX secretion system PorP/SprF family membrane protein
MKKIITLFAFAFGSTLANAQQDPQFSQYMHNKLFMNPAYAGMRNALCVSGIYRNQWNGFDGAPNSGVFSADMPLARYGRSIGGAGLTLMYDKLGFESNLSFRGSYSFHIPVGPANRNGVLGIGIDLGGFSKRVGPSGNQQWVATTNWLADGTIPPQIKKTVLDVGFGLWYQNRKMWFGLSASHLNTSKIDGGTPVVGNSTHDVVFQVARHYFLTGGGKVIETPMWEIKPSFLLKTDATTASLDVNVTALYNKIFWFGASYRVKDAVVPMAGFILRGSSRNEDLGLKIGFAYDYTTSNIKNYSNGSFEIFLNYCMPFQWPEGGGRSERFFE